MANDTVPVPQGALFAPEAPLAAPNAAQPDSGTIPVPQGALFAPETPQQGTPQTTPATKQYIIPGIGAREFDPNSDEGKQILQANPNARLADQTQANAGSSIGPSVPHVPVNIPGAIMFGKVAQHVQDLQNITKDEKASHPIKGAVSDLINKLQDILVGNPEHGGMQTGFLTNPVTSMLIPGGPESSLVANEVEKGGAAVDEAVNAAKSKLGGAAEEEAAATPAAKKPSLVQQIRKGGDVVQPEAEQALRTSVKAGGKEAGLSTVQPQSLRTIVEEPIHSLDASAKSLYRQIDSVSGTDFKALNEKLDNTEYQIRQLTETEEDVQKEAALEKSRTAIMEKIEAAKEQAKAAGVDPAILDRADAQFRRARALSDVEAKVFKNPNIVKGNQVMGTAETVDVDSAVKALQKLQDSTKYGGSRLEQALGKQGANQLLKDLYEAQRVGTKALSRQQFAKWAARIVGLGTAEEVVRHAWQQ